MSVYPCYNFRDLLAGDWEMYLSPNPGEMPLPVPRQQGRCQM